MAGPETWKMVLAKEVGAGGTNLVPNGAFGTNVTGWTATSTLVTNVSLSRQTSAWTGHSAGYARLFADASTGGTARNLAAETDYITLSATSAHFAQATIKIVSFPDNATAGKGVSFDARFYTASGTTPLATSFTSGTLFDFDAEGESTASISFTPPTGAARVKLRVFVSAEGASVGSGDDIEVLFDDVVLYRLSDITWTASNVGDLYNARDRQFSFKLNQPQTIGFTLPITDPMAAELLNAVGESTAIPIIKLYRDTTLMMVAEVTTTEIVNSNDGNAVRVVATETMWPRLSKRLLPSSRSQRGYRITSPIDRIDAIASQLTSINDESPSGLEIAP